MEEANVFEQFTVVPCVGGFRTVPEHPTHHPLLLRLYLGDVASVSELITMGLPALINQIQEVAEQEGILVEVTGDPEMPTIVLRERPVPPPVESFDLSVFEHGDGAHCGLSDWYASQEAALKAALESGKPFSTGWYSSKKEIASARISSDGKSVKVEVSVSDDFDTEGGGERIIPAPATLDEVAQAISAAWGDAEEDQKDNRQYAGYSLIHYTAKIPEYERGERRYPKETRKRYPRKRPFCLDYFIVDVSGDDWSSSPPGDEYSWWGWQNDEEGEGANCVEEGIPKRTVAKFEKFAYESIYGGMAGSLRIGDWEIRSWDNEDDSK